MHGVFPKVCVNSKKFHTFSNIVQLLLWINCQYIQSIFHKTTYFFPCYKNRTHKFWYLSLTTYFFYWSSTLSTNESTREMTCLFICIYLRYGCGIMVVPPRMKLPSLPHTWNSYLVDAPILLIMWFYETSIPTYI